MMYDPSRKLNRVTQRAEVVNGIYKTIYSEVPYNINFSLFAFTRNMDDMLQIIEQILPYFTPDFTITMNFTELDKKIDIPIVLTSVNSIEDYEGDLQTRRMITHSLIFQAKSYIFGPIKTSGLIREISLTFQELTGD